MRNLPEDAMADARDEGFVDFSGPPQGGQIFARLGVMLLIALCFGLAAQLLVLAPPH